MKEELGDHARCLTPERSWAAIARGAAISGRERIVEYRRLRDSIGYPVLVEYDERVHKEAEKIHIGNKVRVQVMHWCFRRGRKLYPGTTETTQWAAMLEDDKNIKSKALIVEQQLYSSSTDVAPKRLDGSCKLAGVLKLDLTHAAREKRAQRKKDSTPRDEPIEINVHIDVAMGSDKGYLRFRA